MDYLERAIFANFPLFWCSDFSGLIIDSYGKIRFFLLNFTKYINLFQKIDIPSHQCNLIGPNKNVPYCPIFMVRTVYTEIR